MSTPGQIKYLRDKLVAILGYDLDAQRQARLLQEYGIEVIIGLRDGDPDRERAARDGFDVANLFGAVERADVIQVW